MGEDVCVKMEVERWVGGDWRGGCVCQHGVGEGWGV